jgi:hypothetical protein
MSKLRRRVSRTTSREPKTAGRTFLSQRSAGDESFSVLERAVGGM